MIRQIARTVVFCVTSLLWVLPAGGAFATAASPDFVDLAKKLKPVVVNISTAKTIKPQRHFSSPFGGSPHGSDPFQDFFDQFFGDRQRTYKQRSLGSGFIISDEGYILTNAHVVAGADEIKVKLADGRELKGTVKGLDEKLDLALVKIDAKDHLPTARLGDSDALEVGEWVMAIGNPFGLGQTVTAGIVSAMGRVIGSGPYDDFIQTDASINPGNSGGPLFNSRGEVVGINAAIVAGGQGIGFAIPINMAKSIIPQLKEKGKVTRGWLGVGIQSLSPELAQSFGLEGEKGALVSEVRKESPADKAGLKTGDILLTFGGKVVHDANELSRLVAATPVGKKVQVHLQRDGKPLDVTVTIGQLKEEGESVPAANVEDHLGLSVQDLTKELAASMGLPVSSGVVVVDVKPGGSADEAGISRGDIVKEINGAKIERVADYEKALATRKKGDVVRFLLRRGEGSLYVALKMD